MNTRSSARPVVLILCLAVSACLPKIHEPYTGAGRARLSAITASLRAGTWHPGVPTVKVEPDKPLRGYDVLDLEFESVGLNRQPNDTMNASYYSWPSPVRRGLVVILPIWGASTYPPKALLRRLQGDGTARHFDIMLVHGQNYLFDWDGIAASSTPEMLSERVEESVAVVENTIRDLRRLVTWALQQPNVDASRVAIVGFSFSAIAATIVAGVDERISHGVFVMGGADLHNVFASCSSFVGRTRLAVTRNLGWSAERLASESEQPLGKINPKFWVSRLDPEKLLVVEAANDHCIPLESRLEFWNALGRPERILIEAGHRYSFFSMTPLGRHWTTRRISEFLVRKLSGSVTDSPLRLAR